MAYGFYLSLSDLLHVVWESLFASTLLQMALFLFFYGVVFHYIYVPHFLNPFTDISFKAKHKVLHLAAPTTQKEVECLLGLCILEATFFSFEVVTLAFLLINPKSCYFFNRTQKKTRLSNISRTPCKLLYYLGHIT